MYHKMNKLQIISSETLEKLTNTRTGEKKFHEEAWYLTNKETFKEQISNPKVEFVVFGIKEDIGVLANQGRPGAKESWDFVLKSLLNIQSNSYTHATNVLILGHLDFSDVYNTLNTTSETSLKTYRKSVEIIDQYVNQLVYEIVKAGKTPIVIGGGHNNAYGLIKGCALALKTKINTINFDAHSDLRALEGRHSGNGFRYAIEEGFLDRYFIFGLHENYSSRKILKYIGSSKSKIKFLSFEALIVGKKTSLKKALKKAMKFISKSNYGIEIDCDAIENMPSSAQTPSGFTANQTRQFVHYFGGQKRAIYLHICEAVIRPNKFELNEQTAKLIAYLITDFIKAKKSA